ncbi:MAG: hypothetical protein HEP71_11115 [Roseivirga sp.]|nr:hypothetical protein [Roseivirga sp.]
MIHKFDFFKTTMPETRKAGFYLGCLNSSVYIDFDLVKGNRISLKRISFDGYGCCELANPKALENEDSRRFIEEINKELLNQYEIEKLIKKAIQLNEANIWAEALEEYKLNKK